MQTRILRESAFYGVFGTFYEAHYRMEYYFTLNFVNLLHGANMLSIREESINHFKGNIIYGISKVKGLKALEH